MRRMAGVLAVLAALVPPGTAAAHVAPGAPVATDFSARIRGSSRPRMPCAPSLSTATASCPSPSARRARRHSRRARRAAAAIHARRRLCQPPLADGAVRPHRGPGPACRRRSVGAPAVGPRDTGHTYRWHEHRLHTLEPLAAGRGAEADLGRSAGGADADRRPPACPNRHAPLPAARGDLGLVRPPARSLLVAAALRDLAAARRRGGHRRATPTRLVLLGTRRPRALRPAGRGGLELPGHRDHRGRPALLLGRCSAAAAASRFFTACLVGIGSLFRGSRCSPMVTHGSALTTLSTTAARVGVARSSGSAQALLAVTLWVQFRRRAGMSGRRAGTGSVNGTGCACSSPCSRSPRGSPRVVVMIVLLGRTPGPV